MEEEVAQEKEQHISDCTASQERDSQDRADMGAYHEKGFAVKTQV